MTAAVRDAGRERDSDAPVAFGASVTDCDCVGDIEALVELEWSRLDVPARIN